MPEDNLDQVSNSPSSGQGNLQKIFILFLVIFGFVATFVTGYILSNLMSSEKISLGQKTTVSNIPKQESDGKTPSGNSGAQQDSTKFLPGKHYFDDTIMIVSKDNPRLDLIATVTRTEQDSGYVENSRASYYDGSNWTRKMNTQTINDSTIVSNSLVKSWNVDIDPSRVLKQTVHGEVSVNNSSVVFTTDTLTNEIGIRSLPGYTKFMSNGKATITVNGVSHDAYVLYTHIYSLNASDIQFYNQPFGLTTDWIAFWDSQGNFYHIDATSVDKPTQIYQTHQLGIMEDGLTGSVAKTFTVNINRDNKNPPVGYKVSLNSPIGVNLDFTRIDGINKSPDGSYTWYMGNVDGTVQMQNGESLSGIGLVEYIHD